MRLPVLGSSFLYLLAVDSLDVLNPRNSSVSKKKKRFPSAFQLMLMAILLDAV